MFDSTIGRWQTKDPKSFDAGDTNLYRYVGNHPSYATDPSGLEEWDPKKLSRAFIDKLIVAGAEMRVHLGSADDKHLTVSYRYIDPETGDERIAIFRDRTTTSWMFWSNTHWELMGTAPLRNMSMKQAFDTIHDSPLSAKSHNDAVAFMQAIPLVRTADSISQGKVIESGLNLGNDVIDVVSLGGTAAVRTAGTETIKWTGRSVLAGQWGYGAYEAYAEGDTSRLKGAAISSVLYAMAGVKNGSSGSQSASSNTAVHFTNETGKNGIEASKYLNGPYSVWTFASDSVPGNKFTQFIKTLVRPSRLTHRVEDINAEQLVKPTIVGPWSLFQRLAGVRRTPGPGTYHIETGVFYPNQLFDPATMQLRSMTSSELVWAGRWHDAALETIGYGIFVGIPSAAAFSYWYCSKVYGDNGSE